jgi:transposase
MRRTLPDCFFSPNLASTVSCLRLWASLFHWRSLSGVCSVDAGLYKWRRLIENFFCKLKEFKRIAMRCDKTDLSFAAFIDLAAAIIHSR